MSLRRSCVRLRLLPLVRGLWRDVLPGFYCCLGPRVLRARDNVVLGNHFGIETKGSLIWGGSRLVATIGLEDMIIVDTDDVLFICPKTQDQKVRQLVNEIKVSSSEYL